MLRHRDPRSYAARWAAALLAAMVLAIAGAHAAGGIVKGGVKYSLPPWFKTSFLDFPDDVAEAHAHGKRVMVFLHLDECPYCARMLEESFAGGENREFIERHFDVVAVNIMGSLEVRWIDGAAYTERALARQLRTFATPTIVFLDPDGSKALQLTGYRDPRALRHALEYVASGAYRDQPFTAWLAARDRPVVYEFRAHPQFADVTDFSGKTGALAVLFEDRYCAECARFHATTLNDPRVTEEMKRFVFVRLDAESNRPIVGLDGKPTTPAQWAKSLGLSYRPAIVLFNEGRELFRADGRLYHLHFEEALRYVGGGYYGQFDTIGQFRAAYRAERLERGVDIDYAE